MQPISLSSTPAQLAPQHPASPVGGRPQTVLVHSPYSFDGPQHVVVDQAADKAPPVKLATDCEGPRETRMIAGPSTPPHSPGAMLPLGAACEGFPFSPFPLTPSVAGRFPVPPSPFGPYTPPPPLRPHPSPSIIVRPEDRSCIFGSPSLCPAAALHLSEHAWVAPKVVPMPFGAGAIRWGTPSPSPGSSAPPTPPGGPWHHSGEPVSPAMPLTPSVLSPFAGLHATYSPKRRPSPASPSDRTVPLPFHTAQKPPCSHLCHRDHSTAECRLLNSGQPHCAAVLGAHQPTTPADSPSTPGSPSEAPFALQGSAGDAVDGEEETSGELTGSDDDYLFQYGDPSPTCSHPKPWKKLRAKRGYKFFVCNHCAARWRLRGSGKRKKSPPPKPTPIP